MSYVLFSFRGCTTRSCLCLRWWWAWLPFITFMLWPFSLPSLMPTYFQVDILSYKDIFRARDSCIPVLKVHFGCGYLLVCYIFMEKIKPLTQTHRSTKHYLLLLCSWHKAMNFVSWLKHHMWMHGKPGMCWKSHIWLMWRKRPLVTGQKKQTTALEGPWSEGIRTMSESGSGRSRGLHFGVCNGIDILGQNDELTLHVIAWGIPYCFCAVGSMSRSV